MAIAFGLLSTGAGVEVVAGGDFHPVGAVDLLVEINPVGGGGADDVHGRVSGAITGRHPPGVNIIVTTGGEVGIESDVGGTLVGVAIRPVDAIGQRPPAGVGPR